MQDSKYLIVGIDPDISKSGVAFLHCHNKRIEYSCLTFVETLKFIRTNKEVIKRVYIEAGWFNKKASWHAAENMKVAASIGKRVGSNHATGQLLAQCIEDEQVKVILVRPTSKKLNAEEFKKRTGIKTRTNQDQRDSIMLIHGME